MRDIKSFFFFFQAEDGIRDYIGDWSSDVCSSDLTPRIGGRGVATGRTAEVVMPHDHRHVLAVWHKGGAAEVAHAIDAALVAHREWSRMAWRDRSEERRVGKEGRSRGSAGHERITQ